MSNMFNRLDIKRHLSLLFMMKNERLLVRNTLKNTTKPSNSQYQCIVSIERPH